MDSVYHHFEKINSTQDWAKENFHAFDLSKLHIITADQQLKGRGRLNRHWHSPQKTGLYVTFSFFVPNLQFSFNPLSLVTGLTFAEVLQKFGLQVLLKWPNDLYVNNKKLGGILTETKEIQGGRIFFIGVGLNVNMSLDELAHIERPATSILAETHKNSSMKSILQPAETIFKRNLKLFLDHGFEVFLKDFEEVSFLAGKKVLFDLGHEVIERKYCRVDKDGALVLKDQNGQEQKYVSGEIKGWE